MEKPIAVCHTALHGKKTQVSPKIGGFTAVSRCTKSCLLSLIDCWIHVLFAFHSSSKLDLLLQYNFVAPWHKERQS